MNTIGSLKIYDIFRKDMHMPDDRALEAVVALDDFFDKKTSVKLEQLATRDELLVTKNELKQEIHTVSVRVENLAYKMDNHMASKVDLEKAKTSMQTFNATLTIAQVVTIIGALFGLLKLFILK